MFAIELIEMFVVMLRSRFAKAVDDALSVAKRIKSAMIAVLKSPSPLVDFRSKVIQH